MGTFIGAQSDLVEIGRGDFVLSGTTSSTYVYVQATLPSVLTAVQLQASIKDGQGRFVKSSNFPDKCSNLPASAKDPSNLDESCLQVAVNPLAVVVPHVIPLSIIYEPPGNCSWANLTEAHTAGTAITVQTTQFSSTQTIHDASVFGFELDKSNVTEAKE